MKPADRESAAGKLLSWLGIGGGLGTFCFTALWAGIDTGPWNLHLDVMESGWTGLFNGARAVFPLAVLATWVVHAALRKRPALRVPTIAEGLWLYYASICFMSTLYVSPWFDSAYWGFAYFAAFAAAELFMHEGGSAVERAVALNRLNWLLASGILVILLWVSRGQLFAQTSMGMSGYGLIDRMPTVAGMPMSRASGMSRFCAIPALLSLVWLCTTRGSKRLIAATIFAATVYLIWMLQSRGSLFSFALAASFSVIIMGGRARFVGFAIAIVTGLVCIAGMIPNETMHLIYLHATRGAAQEQQLLSASGRTTWIYPLVWSLIKKSPVIGYGWRADRRIALADAQNGVLYALLCAGFVGGFGYIAGLLVAWLMLVRIARIRDALTPTHRIAFIQVAGMMAFFTLRTIPENCAALYSVDLLVQLPALVYLGELHRLLRHASAARAAQPVRPWAAAPPPVSIAASRR